MDWVWYYVGGVIGSALGNGWDDRIKSDTQWSNAILQSVFFPVHWLLVLSCISCALVSSWMDRRND